MPGDNTRAFGGGILDRMAQYITSERERTRKAEDDQLSYQQEVIKGLMNRPDFNPAHIGQALQDMYDLQASKGKTRPRASGRDGFMGASELPISKLLTSIYNNERPIMGPTQRSQMVQHGGFESAADEPLASPERLPGFVPSNEYAAQPEMGPGAATESPVADLLTGSGEDLSKHPTQRAQERLAADPAGLAFRQGFTGQSVLNTPVQVPPPPTALPSGGNRMLQAARQMQTEEMLPVPPKEQPILREPDEMARISGRAKGIEATEEARGKRQGDLEALTGMFGKEQALEILKRQALGAAGASPYRIDTTPQLYQDPSDPSKRIAATTKFNQATGEMETVDLATGQPIPAGWLPVGSSTQTDPTSKKEYDAARADALAHGAKTFPSYEEWLTIDANRKRPVINNNTAANQQFNRIDKIRDDFKGDPVVKRYATMNEAYSFVKSLDNNTENPADDQGLIYAFAKAMDPESVVREGEYATVQKYAQSWLEKFGFDAMAILARKGFLTSTARGNLKLTIRSRFQPTKNQYDRLRSQYAQMVRQAGGTEQDLPSYDASPLGAAGGSQHQVGDKITAANGLVLYWDGQGWTNEPVLPNPPR